MNDATRLALLAASPLAAEQPNSFRPLTAATTTPATIDICDRTPEVEAAILAAIPAPAPSCGAVPASSLSAIDSLGLNGEGLTALLAGDFDNLTALHDLWLSSNRLTSLSAGIFDNLAALKSLQLGGNRLTSLPAGIFDNLTALRWLRLDGS